MKIFQVATMQMAALVVLLLVFADHQIVVLATASVLLLMGSECVPESEEPR